MNAKTTVTIVGNDQTRPATESAKRNLQGLGAEASKLSAAWATVAGGAAVGALAAFSQSIVETRIQYERLNNTLGQAVGTSRVTQELSFIRETVSRLGLEFNSTAETYAKFAAASRGTSLEGEQTRQAFLAVSQAAGALGLNAEQSSGALLALQQMISKGKVSAEELRGQLGERLPGAFQIAARAMNMTVAELDKLVSSGNLATEDFLPKFSQQLQTEFADSAARAAQSTQASVNRIESSWQSLKTSVANSPVGEAAAASLSHYATGLDIVSTRLRNAQAAATGFYDQVTILSQALGTFNPLEARYRALASIGQYNEQEMARLVAKPRIETPPLPSLADVRRLDNLQLSGITDEARKAFDKMSDQIQSPGAKLQSDIAEARRLGGLTGQDPSAIIAELNRRANASSNTQAASEAKRRAEALDRTRSELAGVNPGFNEELSRRFELFQRGEISIDKYRASVERLIETETEAGRQAVSDREERDRILEKMREEQGAREQLAQSYLDLVQPADKYLEKLREVRDLEDRGLLNRDQSTAIQVKISEQITDLQKTTDQAKDLDDTGRKLGLTFSSSFEDAVAAGKNFRSVLDGIQQDVIRMATRKLLTQPTMDWLGTALKGFSIFGGGGGSGTVSSGMDMLDDQSWAQMFGVGRREAGGPVSKGRPYIVGEKRAELFVPDMDGFIVPEVPGAMARNATRAGATYVQNITATGGANYADVFNASKAAYAHAMADTRERELRGG